MENISYKAQRDAKTADEYLLKCLFQAEDERDAVIKEYQDKMAELDKRLKKIDDATISEGNEPHFESVPTEGFRCILENSRYQLDGLETIERYKELLHADDDELLEWARQPLKLNSWSTRTPLKISEQDYSYCLSYKMNDHIEKFVSTRSIPEGFSQYIDNLTSEIKMNIEQYLIEEFVFDISLKDEVVKLALMELREGIKETIEHME